MVFSISEQAVHSHWLFGKKHLMAFDIGAIKPFTTGFGMMYFGLFGLG